MYTVCRDIFRAIHEGKWLSIVYRNKQEETTKYWISIHNIIVVRRTLQVEGLHLGTHSIERFDYIYIDSILSSSIIESSYAPVNEKLVQDIHWNPEKYKSLFDHSVSGEEIWADFTGVPEAKDRIGMERAIYKYGRTAAFASSF